MFKRTLVPAALALTSMALAPAASACSCMMPGEVTAENLKDTFVFRGTPISKEVSDAPLIIDGIEYFTGNQDMTTRFNVRHVYHEVNDGKDIFVTHGTSSASCGRNFTIGQSVFLVAYRKADKLHASLCEAFTEDAILKDQASDAPLSRVTRFPKDAMSPLEPYRADK